MSTLAGDLARALGDVAAMQELYADDISWTLPTTIGRIGGTTEGKEAVVALNKMSFGAYDRAAGFNIEVHEEYEAEGGRSVARIRARLTVRETGEGYDNEYVILVRESEGKIVDVIEYLDTLKVMHYEGLRKFLPAIPGVTIA